MSCFFVCIVRQNAWFHTFALELLSNPNKLTQFIPGFSIISQYGVILTPRWSFNSDPCSLRLLIVYLPIIYITCIFKLSHQVWVVYSCTKNIWYSVYWFYAVDRLSVSEITCDCDIVAQTIRRLSHGLVYLYLPCLQTCTH